MLGCTGLEKSHPLCSVFNVQPSNFQRSLVEYLEERWANRGESLDGEVSIFQQGFLEMQSALGKWVTNFRQTRRGGKGRMGEEREDNEGDRAKGHVSENCLHFEQAFDSTDYRNQRIGARIIRLLRKLFTHYVLRFTFHVSRFTFHVSRNTPHGFSIGILSCFILLIRVVRFSSSIFAA